VFHYNLFQENISFGTDHHLHSSSDVWEVVSSTILLNTVEIKIKKIFFHFSSELLRSALYNYGAAFYMFINVF
jgi:hypothetical protein